MHVLTRQVQQVRGARRAKSGCGPEPVGILPRMGKVLVVGGAGYIGGWLTDKIQEAGHEVRVFDVLLYEDQYLKDVDFVHGNILERSELRPHVQWADAVV